MSNAKFEVEKFDMTNNFGMWQCEVLDVLIQQDLEVKPDYMSEKDWAKLNRKACGTIRLCHEGDISKGVVGQTKYMIKSDKNRLYLTKKLFFFSIQARYVNA